MRENLDFYIKNYVFCQKKCFRLKDVDFPVVKNGGGVLGEMKNTNLITYENVLFAIETSSRHGFRILDHEGGSILAAAAQL